MINLGIIGDVLIDYTLMHGSEDKMRHGGIMHAARGAFALNIDYTLFYFGPQYLEKSIGDFSRRHNGKVSKIGNVTGCPNIILIKEVKETGDQGYELILREAKQYNYIDEVLATLSSEMNFSDYLVLTGGYDFKVLCSSLSKTKSNVHVDISNDIEDFAALSVLERKFSTVFISTSSKLFLVQSGSDPAKLVESIKPFAEKIVFKENRGGSRLFDFKSSPISIPSQTKPIVHSVGVGDNYDVAYIWAQQEYSQTEALNFASWVAAEYASTTFVDDFKKGVERTIKLGIENLVTLGGVTLSWEDRKSINIYIAAPDFDYVDTTPVRQLEQSLIYHNFSPRLPIKEHGQLQTDSSKELKVTTCYKDIELLEKCQLVIGVLIYDDPGTLLELGYAIAKGIPTFIYDPYNKTKNCILEFLPTLVSSNLDEIISQVFISSSKVYK